MDGSIGHPSDATLGYQLRRQIAVETLGAAFAALRTRGCKAVSIWCLSDNVAAIGFYQHLGGARIPESRQENVGGAMFPVVGFIWPLS